MDLSEYNGNQPKRRFPRAMLELKFWFNTSKTSTSDTIDDDNVIKSRTEKILRSFKRTFRRSGSRFRDSKITHYKEAMQEAEIPPVPPPRIKTSPMNSPYLEVVNPAVNLAQERINLAKHGWYWGPLTKRQAEIRLSQEPDGAFLVRDSSSHHHIYTLSLRSYSFTMHTHIEYANGMFKLGTSLARPSVPELINDALELSQDSIFSYSQHCTLAPTPIRLLKPVSRNMETRSLMHMCRFVIREHCNMNAIKDLPLPTTLQQYLLQGQY